MIAFLRHLQFLISIALLSSSLAWAGHDPTQMSRRGFLKFLGQGAASASVLSGGGGVDIVSAILSDFQRIGVGEMLEAYRKELLDAGLLGEVLGPHDEHKMTRVWSYRKLLAEALHNKELPAHERQLVLKLLEELRPAYPTSLPSQPTVNQSNPTSNQDGAQSEVESTSRYLKRLIEIRQKLSPRLLVRMAWQNAFPDDLILNTNGAKDLERLDLYYYRLVLFKDAYELELSQMEPKTLVLSNQWLEEVTAVLSAPAVREWSQSHPDCFKPLN